jgi:3-oxoadipate enol-lactonase
MNLYHRFDGPDDAPVIALSSSLGTTNELWDPQAAELAKSFRVLRYDHRGHGRSDVPPGPYTVERLSTDVVELLDRLGVGSVTFCGLSLGGAVGMWLSSRMPERVERLVLCCTSARFADREFWLERARTVRERGVAAVADVVLERWFTAAFRAKEPETVERFRGLLLSTPREGYAACCDALAEWDFRDELRTIGAPTLVVVAEHDLSAPPEHGELIARRVLGAGLVAVLGAAHLANVEQPEAITQAIAAHAQREPV